MMRRCCGVVTNDGICSNLSAYWLVVVRNMSLDPVAAAVEWLDAYRAADLDMIVGMHADEAVVDCRCCVRETVTNKERLRAFWKERFDECVPSDLLDVQPVSSSGTSISFATPRGKTTAVFVFNRDGKIIHMEWGAPTKR